MKKVICTAIALLCASSTFAKNDLDVSVDSIIIDRAIPYNYNVNLTSIHKVHITNNTDETKNLQVIGTICAPNFPCNTRIIDFSVSPHASYDNQFEVSKIVSYPFKVKTYYSSATDVIFNGNKISTKDVRANLVVR